MALACLEVQPKCLFLLVVQSKCFFPGNVHTDPSHSHMEEKGGFMDFFMPCHFKVINSKSESPFLLKALGPRTW